MVFTTPEFERLTEASGLKPVALNSAAVLILVVLLSACSPPPQDFGFVIEDIDSFWRNDRLIISTQQRLSLSDDAREALVHGVPLTIDHILIIRKPGSEDNLKTHVSSYEVRYLPLSDHYQLAGPGHENIRTFPRLRHVMAELGAIDVPIDTVSLTDGDYELLARSRLNRRKVPPPMRLPVWFSDAWKHDTDWTPQTISVPAPELRS
jgi:hypothetical protein